MQLKHIMIMAISAALIAAAPMLAIGAEKTVVVAKADLKWKNMGTSGATA